MLAARKQSYIEPQEEGAWVVPQQRPTVRRRPAPNYGKRVMSVITTLVVASVAFFLVMRFDEVSRQYAVNNEIKDEIRAVKQHIGDLKVELEFAVDLNRVQRLAQEAEMDYPEADQVFEIQRDMPAN